MTNRIEKLNELRAVLEAQMELLRLVLYVTSQGPTLYKGQWFGCVLERDKARTTAAVSMGAGQSMNTILKNSNEAGIAVRDVYPIVRAVVEGFINAAFFVTQPVEVSQRALRHRDYAAWKHHNRVVGPGDFVFTLGSDPNPKMTIKQRFPEFAGKGQDSWSNLNAPVGHTASVALVAAAVALGLSMDRVALQALAGALLVVIAVHHLAVRKARRARTPAGHAGLALWSFMMSTAHGAGLMLVPALIPLCIGDAPAREITASGSLTLALAAVGVHTAAMLAVTGVIASVVCGGFGAGASLLQRLGWKPPSAPG